MDKDFWFEKWENNQIGFHKSDTNPLLQTHFADLDVPEGGRIFLPLCGKTLDISWLMSRGYHVIGSEWSELAIEQLFTGLNIEPEISPTDSFKRFSGPQVDIFVGDIFDLSSGLLGDVDAVYDRAALVALPKDLRFRYSAHLSKITRQARQLLITLNYDQTQLTGPPFSVPDEEVHAHYRGAYRLSRLTSNPIPGGLKGRCAATEQVWRLTRR